MISDKLFNEIKDNAIEIWQTYDDTYGYATEKIQRVQSITNVQDNYGGIIGMFDHVNQRKLYELVSPEAQALIDDWVGGLSRVEKMAKELGL